MHPHFGVVGMMRNDVGEDISHPDVLDVGTIWPGDVDAKGRLSKRSGGDSDQSWQLQLCHISTALVVGGWGWYTYGSVATMLDKRLALEIVEVWDGFCPLDSDIFGYHDHDVLLFLWRSDSVSFEG